MPQFKSSHARALRMTYGRLNIGKEGYARIADAIMATPRRMYHANDVSFDFHRGRIRVLYSAGGRTRTQAIESDGEVPGINMNNPTGGRVADAIMKTNTDLRS